MDERSYLVCELCEEVVPLDDAFSYADERMLVCRACTTAVYWTVGSGPGDRRDGGVARP